ncbi:MAG: TolC family protein [Balneola sp.]|nr:TolC family protein [Balneola sp.]MBO6651424.1 TolC family protein [Balneola sp.]MBO6712539.1 TolC family protein [Balneola sp.]MBO6800968.1 TolC family protein [Balneola sp.]MBO6870640.1 TolC family protein [Balneola sp.]
MNKRTLFSLFVIILLGTIQISAQAVRSLTLKESIEIAKDNSPLSRAATFSLIASKWRYKSFRADLLPGFALSGDAPNFSNQIFANVQDDGTVVFSRRTQSEASINFSASQNILPTGGNLSLSTGITRLGIFNGENTYAWQSTPLIASYTQPLFQFNNLKWRNKIEPLRFKIAEKQFVEDLEDLSFTVTQSFFDVLISKINVEIAEFNVTVNDSIYNISKGRYEVGSLAENDLLQTELAYRNAETSLTNAKLNYQRAEENFKALLGIDNDVTLEVKAPNTAPDINLDFDKALELALENNSQSLQFRLDEIQANQAYDQAKKNAGFTATLRADYGLNQTSTEFEDLYTNPDNRQFFNVRFQIPIFNWGKNIAQIKSARNQQLATANSIEYQRLQFELSVRSTVREFELLKGQVELAEISDNIAERRYDVSKNRYLIGKIDITNLFIAQNEKDSARRNYIQALRNYWSGYYNLRRLTLYDFAKDQPIYHEIDL